MSQTIEKAIKLKQAIVDFIYDAEGELAVALESYAAEHNKKNSYGIKQQNLTVDSFISAGEVAEKTPLAMFLAEVNSLTKSDRNLIEGWQNNVMGLFEIKEIHSDCYQLYNWLTAKEYRVYSHGQIETKETSRWQKGEIILTIIAPINNNDWFFFSDRVIKGKLSPPKLAVAVGEFRDNFPEFLYADAPELLEEAWESVAIYHQEFIDYFGSDQVTMPGYKLNQNIGELQQIMSKKRLAEAGIDDSKTFSQIITESGANEEEFTKTATDLGTDAEAVAKIINNKNTSSMVMPKVDLPPEIKQAESVTVFSHPRWGQMFLPNYEKFTKLLDSENLDSQENANSLIRKYLDQPEANYYIWQHLKDTYPQKLEKLLQDYTEKSQFNLTTDLDQLLAKHKKLFTPQLSSLASVPIHLNNLFEIAVAQVQKTKTKTPKKSSKGFLTKK